MTDPINTSPDNRDQLLIQAMEALTRWQRYGCPDCGGDCASANPPVACCVMAETRDVHAALAAAIQDTKTGEEG